MKQTLLYALSSFVLATFMTACSTQVADKMAELEPTLSSDPCVEIDRKVMRLDRFTEVVKNTSAFHLEEKATALPVPGITVSNNRKQMLRDAEKKYAEYAAEQQKYGCKTPKSAGTTQVTDKTTVVDYSMLPSDSCAVIDQKVMRLDRFTEMVKNTSAFHLEEKATALQVPGITVSNNRKQMLRDAEKKYAEYAAEHQKQGCKAPVPSYTSPILDKKEVMNKPALSSEPSADGNQKMMKTDESTMKASSASTAHLEEDVAVVPVPKSTVNKKVSEEKKKDTELAVARQQDAEKAPITVGTAQTVDKKEVATKPALFALSSKECKAIAEELIKLDEFMIMVNNTSAFHLEEKAEAMPVPGITVSNNKKKMLRDAERKRASLLAERQKQGCETADKQ